MDGTNALADNLAAFIERRTAESPKRGLAAWLVLHPEVKTLLDAEIRRQRYSLRALFDWLVEEKDLPFRSPVALTTYAKQVRRERD